MTATADADALRAQLSDLLRRVARGDRKALGAVYTRTSAKLFGVCLRITRDREAAEDILQQVYIKVWTRAGRFDPDVASPITWLCAIARNAAIDWLRKHGRSGLPATGFVEPDAAEPGEGEAGEARGGEAGLGDALAVMAAGEERAQIFDCLETLAPQQRRAIQLAFFDGLSHSELASAMRMPLGTTKSWIRRGLLQLRGCLQGD